MPTPWIAAWTALLSRVAERFVQPEGPVEDRKPRRVPVPKRASAGPLGPGSAASPRQGPPHRSGQRHG